MRLFICFSLLKRNYTRARPATHVWKKFMYLAHERNSLPQYGNISCLPLRESKTLIIVNMASSYAATSSNLQVKELFSNWKKIFCWCFVMVLFLKRTPVLTQLHIIFLISFSKKLVKVESTQQDAFWLIWRQRLVDLTLYASRLSLPSCFRNVLKSSSSWWIRVVYWFLLCWKRLV